MNKYLWQFLDTKSPNRIKHAFYSESSQAAICGRTALGVVNTTKYTGKWKTDPERLADSRPCARCVRKMKQIGQLEI